MKTMTCERREVHTEIPARLEGIDEVCAEVTAFLHEHEMDRWRFDVILLTREALTNAVIHGCRLNATLRIRFTLALEGCQLVMTVEDPGPGFDWRARKDSSVDGAEEKGRGISIYRCYATEVSFNPQGNRVTLRKTVTDEETY